MNAELLALFARVKDLSTEIANLNAAKDGLERQRDRLRYEINEKLEGEGYGVLLYRHFSGWRQKPLFSR